MVIINNINKNKLFVVFVVSIFLISGCKRVEKLNRKASKMKYNYEERSKHTPKDPLNYDKKLSSLIKEPYDRTKVGITIQKSKYTLTVNYKGVPVKQYPIVLGSNPVKDKLTKHDGRTPEGNFNIVLIYEHQRWGKFLRLNYPNKESLEKFFQAKEKGLISPNSSVGGEIGIHGTPEDEDFLINDGINWTTGSISLKRDDMNEITSYVLVGTPVIIKH